MCVLYQDLISTCVPNLVISSKNEHYFWILTLRQWTNAAVQLTHAFVSSQLDYCNTCSLVHERLSCSIRDVFNNSIRNVNTIGQSTWSIRIYIHFLYLLLILFRKTVTITYFKNIFIKKSMVFINIFIISANVIWFGLEIFVCGVCDFLKTLNKFWTLHAIVFLDV